MIVGAANSLTLNAHSYVAGERVVCELALTGQEAEARDVLGRYFLIRGTKTRTIAQLRALAYSDNPAYLASRERWYEGLRRAGMPEE